MKLLLTYHQLKFSHISQEKSKVKSNTYIKKKKEHKTMYTKVSIILESQDTNATQNIS